MSKDILKDNGPVTDKKTLGGVILEVLNESISPVSIVKIADSKKLRNYNRIDIADMLIQMQRSGQISKKLVQGKSLYFVPSDSKKTVNQVHIQIDSLQKNLSDNAEDAIKMAAETIQKTGKVHRQKSDICYIQNLKLTYEKKKKQGGKKYIMDIPDLFTVKKEEGRDFVAEYEPSKKQKIIIYASNFLEREELSKEEPLKLESYAQYFGVFYWQSNLHSMLEAIYGSGNAELLITEVGACYHGKEDNVHEYNFMIYAYGGYQQMRIRTEGFLDDDETVLSKVTDIMKGFRLRKPLPEITVLNDPSFMTDFNSVKLRSWKKSLLEAVADIEKGYKYEIFKEGYRLGVQGYSEQILKTTYSKIIREILKRESTAFDKLSEQILDFMKNAQFTNFAEGSKKSLPKLINDYVNEHKKVSFSMKNLVDEEVECSSYKEILKELKSFKERLQSIGNAPVELITSPEQIHQACIAALLEDLKMNPETRVRTCLNYNRLALKKLTGIHSDDKYFLEINQFLNDQKSILTVMMDYQNDFDKKESDVRFDRRFADRYIEDYKRYESRINSCQSEMNQLKGTYETELKEKKNQQANLKEQLDQIQKQVDALAVQRKSLSFFKFSERSSIAEQINTLDNEYKKLAAQYNEIPSLLVQIEKNFNHDFNRKEREMKRWEEKGNPYKQRIEKYQKAMEKDEKLLRESKSAFLEKKKDLRTSLEKARKYIDELSSLKEENTKEVKLIMYSRIISQLSKLISLLEMQN